jgi:glycosyltransferase involved in cell wall biosynthesis
VRVLFVSQRLPPDHVSGAPIQALALARALRKEDIEVTILTSRFERRQPTGALEIEGVRVHRLPTIAGVKASYAALAAAWVRRRDFDLIHGHALSASSLGALSAARVPVLLKPSLGGPSGDLSRIKKSPLAPLLLRVLERADRFSIVEPGIADELREIGIDESKLIPMKNGVDLDRFRPDGPIADLEVEGPVVLFAGQMIARKRVDLLMQAWLQIERARADVSLALAGPGDPPHGVRVLPLGIRSDMDALMRRASVLVLPSAHEGLPNVLLEALATGLPAITTAPIADLPVTVAPTADDIARAVLESLDRPRPPPPEAIRAYGFDRVARAHAALYREMS